MKKELTVVIRGEVASGKTTLALAFKEFLLSKEFTGVDVCDADVNENPNAPYLAGLQGNRMEAIKDTQVSIVTVQMPKLRG